LAFMILTPDSLAVTIHCVHRRNPIRAEPRQMGITEFRG
jgi:hypothetical protein